MSKESKREVRTRGVDGPPSKKLLVRNVLTKLGATLVALGLLGGGAWFTMSQGLLDPMTGGKNIEFQQLDQEAIPTTIETELIPEYRELERALGCIVEEKIYVVVTRGEKPTAGYDITIEKMKLENIEGKKNLVVTARFIEPEAGQSVAQVISYPYKVAITELESLPDSIELRTIFE